MAADASRTDRRVRSNSLIRWMFESPVDRLFKGLLLPLVLLAGLIAALVWNPATESDVVFYDSRTGQLVDETAWRADTTGAVQKRTVVTYWEKWSGFEGEAIQDTVDYFNRKPGKIFVRLVVQGDITQKTRIATAGGNPPDLAGLYSFDVPVFAAQNALLPLDDVLREAGIGPETYVPAYWRLCVHEGKTWALPTTPATLALHWNKKLFREAGLDPEQPPRTIQELDKFAEKLTKWEPPQPARQPGESNLDYDARLRDWRRVRKLTQIGFLHTEPGWWKYSWGFWFGAELWNGNDRITANSPENLAAMKWVRSYVDRYGADQIDRFKKTFGSFDSVENAFFTGKVAMEIQGVWMANFIKRYTPSGFEWGAAPFPSAVPGLENVTIGEADVIGIPRGARRVREAFEFMKFMATPEGMEILCRGHAKNSPLRKTSPGWEQGHPNPYVGLFTRLADGPNCKQTPPIGIWREYQQSFGRAFDDVWTAKKTPEAALDELQAEIQRRLDHELWRARGSGRMGEDRP